MMQLMKASAGSGKTYALAREYIKLLLQDREVGFAYRHILAVTFTNKATAEMKSRIIDELDTLANYPEKSPYMEYLLRETDLQTPKQVSDECSKALRDILGDYGAFSVSTIDKFFQRVLRAFSREIGQFAQYQIELDKNMLVCETVDRILDSLTGEKDDLLKWLSQSSIETIESGEGYHLESRLGDFASGYMSENYRQKVDRLKIDSRKAFSTDNIKSLRTICTSVQKKFDEQFKAAVSELARIASGYACLSKNFNGVIAKFLAYRSGDEIDFTSTTWTKALDNIETAFKKSDAAFKFIGEGDKQTLLDACKAVQACAGLYPTMRTAKLLRSQVAVFHIAETLDREFEAMLKEKNVLSLEDTNSILRDIISDDNAPFIYEKVGVKYQHFLLDEFQDTSLTQWENFKPLLLNSLAENCYNLIVGDVKQSIYRWRNAEWDILDSKVEEELDPVSSVSLQDNWRSAGRIVDFNNAFYKYLADRMDGQLEAKIRNSAAHLAQLKKPISEIYSDVRQNARCRIDADGYVEATFCDSSLIVDYAVEAVERGRQNGFSWSDMAVIVRTNAMGGEVAARLVERDIPVVSNDSLKICSGMTVRRLVSCLCALDDPSDAIGTYYAGDFDPTVLKKCQSLSDMAETILRGFDREEVNADTLYVLAFMDLLRDYVSRNGNSLHSFLQYWKEDGVEKNISSPDGSDAVTIITIHKVKGLDYPYVVIPFPKSESFIRSTSRSWECPALEGTELEATGKALYLTGLSEKSRNTLFAENYCNELRLSYIDAANVWYVATTRASQTMILVGPASKTSTDEFKQVSEALAAFVSSPDSQFVPLEVEDPLEEKPVVRYGFGVQQCKAPARDKWRKPSSSVTTQALKYMPELAGAGLVARDQVKIKTSAPDFFKDSRRLRGIALHKILESVFGPGDLAASVERARKNGLLDAAQASEALGMLADALESVSARGWFPGDRSLILDEREILTPDGNYRPDRVIRRKSSMSSEAESIEIIDYKFAAADPDHCKQVAGYMELYRQMGYTDVRGYLWYVETGVIEEVNPLPLT